MKLASPLILLMAAAASLPAEQTIPKERTFVEAWSRAGYPGEIPAPARMVDVRDHGALGDGVGDDSGAMTEAISKLAGKPGVVRIPEGVYLIQSPIRLPSGIVLRGEGAENTVLRFDFVAHAILASANQKEPFQPVTGGADLHSDRITVADGLGFAAGDYAEIRQENDPAWNASSWARRAAGQIVQIRVVNGDELELETALRLDYPAERSPEIRRIHPVTDVGVEDLKVERLLAGDKKQRDNQFTIGFRYAARCWVRGVEGHNAFGGHVGAQSSTQIEVTGCYFHHAHDYDGGGSGYGVRLELQTGDCLVEDNIFESLRHSMLMQAGANGNVFAYNYSRKPKRVEMPSEISSDITLHGNYAHANLIEGNICEHICVDNSHGANGSLNTIFRNRAETYGINVTDKLADRMNIVGNETFKGAWSIISGDGYALGAGREHFEFGNLTEADGLQPDGTDGLTDVSYYLRNGNQQLLDFWTIEEALPVIGPPHDLETPKTNPAHARYDAGGQLTVPAPRG